MWRVFSSHSGIRLRWSSLGSELRLWQRGQWGRVRSVSEAELAVFGRWSWGEEDGEKSQGGFGPWGPAVVFHKSSDQGAARHVLSGGRRGELRWDRLSPGCCRSSRWRAHITSPLRLVQTLKGPDVPTHSLSQRSREDVPMPPPHHRETEAWESSGVVPQLAGDRSVTVTPALGPQRPCSYTARWPVSTLKSQVRG